MSSTSATWVVEWSPQQRSIFINTLSQAIANNIAMVERGDHMPTWVIVGVTDSREAARQLAAELEPRLQEMAGRR